eukprot:1139810-Pelagomonas_calceolata.AAC.6
MAEPAYRTCACLNFTRKFFYFTIFTPFIPPQPLSSHTKPPHIRFPHTCPASVVNFEYTCYSPLQKTTIAQVQQTAIQRLTRTTTKTTITTATTTKRKRATTPAIDAWQQRHPGSANCRGAGRRPGTPGHAASPG